jgi:hypothetical protein
MPQAISLPVKLHAEQLSASAGKFAAAMGALVDHQYLDEEGVDASPREVLNAAPVLYYLRKHCRPLPLRSAFDTITATSAPVLPNPSLLAMNMACVIFGLTPEEALASPPRRPRPSLADRGRSHQSRPISRSGTRRRRAPITELNPRRRHLNGSGWGSLTKQFTCEVKTYPPQIRSGPGPGARVPSKTNWSKASASAG